MNTLNTIFTLTKNKSQVFTFYLFGFNEQRTRFEHATQHMKLQSEFYLLDNILCYFT